MVNDSGQFSGTRNRMSKRRSPYLRCAIWLAAFCARRSNPQLREYYESKVVRGKHPMVATGAVAQRLTHIIHVVWTKNSPFAGDYTWTPPDFVP
jgi:transposase